MGALKLDYNFVTDKIYTLPFHPSYSVNKLQLKAGQLQRILCFII